MGGGKRASPRIKNPLLAHKSKVKVKTTLSAEENLFSLTQKGGKGRITKADAYVFWCGAFSVVLTGG